MSSGLRAHDLWPEENWRYSSSHQHSLSDGRFHSCSNDEKRRAFRIGRSGYTDASPSFMTIRGLATCVLLLLPLCAA